MVKKRNSNIEMLRMLSMLFVVISHYSVHNGINNNLLPLGINRFLLEISSLGNIGVILFIFITGYFMSDNKKGVRIGKLFILYLQVLFYSVVIYWGFVICGYEMFSIKELIKYIFPITFQQYWFVTAYIILYLLSPYINRLLDNLSRKDNLKFLGIMFLIFSVLPTFTKMDFYGNEIIQFILFYSIGAYFKKYPDNVFSRSKKFNYVVLIGTILLLLSSIIVLDVLYVKFDFGLSNSIYFLNRNSCLAILFSMSLFNLFINKKQYCSKIVNTLSSCSFGVYLLSDHNVARRFLWIDLFKNADFVLSNYFILHFVCSIVLVFVICGMIEFIRKNTVERLMIYFLSKRKENKVSIFNKINKFIENRLGIELSD